MSELPTASRSKFQQLIQTAQSPEERPEAHESEYMWRGHRFRIVPFRQAPVSQFRLRLSPQQSLQVKYAYITHHVFRLQNIEELNEIEFILRDSMRIQITGFNFVELDEALLVQRVIDVQHVASMHAEAALADDPQSCVITDIRVEYGRFDIENQLWLPGDGYWCEEQRQWVANAHQLPS